MELTTKLDVLPEGSLFSSSEPLELYAKPAPVPKPQSNAEKKFNAIRREHYAGRDTDPMTFMTHVMMGNLEALGMKAEDESQLNLRIRLDAAKEIKQYLYSKVKSIDVKVEGAITHTRGEVEESMSTIHDILSGLAQSKASGDAPHELLGKARELPLDTGPDEPDSGAGRDQLAEGGAA